MKVDILKNESIVNKETNANIKMQLNDFTNVCLKAYLDNNYENLEQALMKERKLKKRIVEDINIMEAESGENVYQSFKYRYQYIQTYNIMNKLLNLHIRKQNIEKDIIGVINSFGRARDVIFFLYNNSDVRQCTMKNQMDISPSTLHDLLEELVSIRCVEKIYAKKIPIYNLTVDGRRYVDDNFGSFNEVRIINKEELRDCQKNVFEQRLEKSKLMDNNIIQQIKNSEFRYSNKNREEFLAWK